MKVYGTILHTSHGQFRAVVQSPNKKAAAAAFGITMHHMNGWASVTGNPRELEAAARKPGSVFWVSIRDAYRSDAVYTERPARGIPTEGGDACGSVHG
jgi:hypothetical protein